MSSNATAKIELILEGLGCANCANKIEAQTNQLDSVSSAVMNFVTKKLTIITQDNADDEAVITKVKQIVKKLEPDVIVNRMPVGTKKKTSRHSDDHDHGHGHSHDHSHDEEGRKSWKKEIRLGIGVVVFAMAVLTSLPFYWELATFLLAYVLIGGDVLLKFVRNLRNGQLFDENFLMSVATIGAFAVQEFPEGVAVMLFYQTGEYMQDLAVNRSRKSIKALMDIKPDYANIKLGNDVRKVSPDEVAVGDIIIVKPGERVPLDGKVIDGVSMLDTSALTGESVPREVAEGDVILSGFVNKNGLLTVEVTKEFGESTVAKILDLVQNAGSKKAPTENFITKFARYYTPAVVFAAVALAVIPPLVMADATFSEWVYRALVFLVISCPCALVISIPLSFFGGIGGASRNGILIKGGNFLEALNQVDTVVFDKTGTLTKGTFKVSDIQVQPGVDHIDERALLRYAAYAESYSNHPIATSIMKAYGEQIQQDEIEQYEEVAGHGIKITMAGQQIAVGNGRLMEREGIEYSSVSATGTVVYVAIDQRYMGYIVIADEIKEDSAAAIQGLKAAGVKKVVMLTGDRASVANDVAAQLGVDQVYAELLPDQKVEKIEMLEQQKSEKGKMVFVGDGINDAPVLARVDIGVAMGGLGSDAAIEAADIVIMTDEPIKLVKAMAIAKKTRRIVWQNIVFALGVKGIVLLLGAYGMAAMWEAVFADVGVALIAIFNAMRVMKS